MQTDIATLGIMVGIIGVIVGSVGVAIAWLSYKREKAELRIDIKLVTQRGDFGIAVKEKDHILVTALNVGRQPLVLDAVNVSVRISFRYWFKHPKYDPHKISDKFGGLMTGGSFGNPQKIEPGFDFKMILGLSAGVLVGHHVISNIQIPDSVGNIYQPTWLEMFLIKRGISKQYPEWQKLLNFCHNFKNGKSKMEMPDKSPIESSNNT